MTPPTTMTDMLLDAGFTASEVARLIRARARYTPYHEHFSVREYQRLSFLRWQFQRGFIQS